MEQKYSHKKTYMSAFPKDVDINNFLTEFAVKNRIKTASLNFIGSLTQVSLGYYNQKTKEYQEKEFSKSLEIISGTGNISTKDGKVFVHCHVVLSDENYQTIGGHLFSSKIFAGEYVMHELPELIRTRSFDPVTGLSLWKRK